MRGRVAKQRLGKTWRNGIDHVNLAIGGNLFGRSVRAESDGRIALGGIGFHLIPRGIVPGSFSDDASAALAWSSNMVSVWLGVGSVMVFTLPYCFRSALTWVGLG